MCSLGNPIIHLGEVAFLSFTTKTSLRFLILLVSYAPDLCHSYFVYFVRINSARTSWVAVSDTATCPFSFFLRHRLSLVSLAGGRLLYYQIGHVLYAPKICVDLNKMTPFIKKKKRRRISHFRVE